jgi:hypothetical protein
VRFGTWNVRSLYRRDSFRAAARKLYKLDLVGVKRLGGIKLAQEEQGIIIFSLEQENENLRLGKGLVHADDVNILGGILHTLKEDAEALIEASKEIA